MPSLVPLDDTIGAMHIGLVTSTAIYGVTCLQVYIYFTENASKDRLLLKYFVVLLLALDTLHLALITHVLYFYTVTNFGDYERLQTIIWSLEIQLLVGNLLTVCVQGFFAWRLYILSQRKSLWLPCAIVLSSTALLVTSVVFIVRAFKHKLITATPSWSDIPWAAAGLSSELLGDVVITGGMMHYLRWGRAGFQTSNRAITMLVTYTLNTCMLTTLFTIVTLALFVTAETTLIYAPFYFVLTRLYSCAFMSTLNTRKALRAQLSGSGRAARHESISLSHLGSGSGGGGDKGSGAGGGGVGKEQLHTAQTRSKLRDAEDRDGSGSEVLVDRKSVV